MKDNINYYVLLPALSLLFLLEATFLAQIPGVPLLPDFVFLLLLADILLSSSADFIYLAFFFGFLSDLFSGGQFGIRTLSFVLIALLANRLKNKFLPKENFFRVALFSGACAILYDLLYLFLLVFVFDAPSALYAGTAMPKLLLDGVFATGLVYPLMQLIYKRQE